MLTEIVYIDNKVKNVRRKSRSGFRSETLSLGAFQGTRRALLVRTISITIVG